MFEMHAHAAANEHADNLQRLKEYVAILDHEMRNSLAAISTSVDILSMRIDEMNPEQRRDRITRIQANIQELSELLDDVRTLGKLEMGSTADDKKLLSLNDLVQGLIKEMENADDTTHEFRFETDCTGALIYANERLLKMALRNLLVNAAKYSLAESTIRVCLKADRCRFLISVEDSGIGIPPSELADVFEPFYRCSNVGELSGSGLGLTIVKRVVDLHKGRLDVTSEVGIGSRFTLSLPCA